MSRLQKHLSCQGERFLWSTGLYHSATRCFCQPFQTSHSRVPDCNSANPTYANISSAWCHFDSSRFSFHDLAVIDATCMPFGPRCSVRPSVAPKVAPCCKAALNHSLATWFEGSATSSDSLLHFCCTVGQTDSWAVVSNLHIGMMLLQYMFFCASHSPRR
jgi:hypothetical protein